MNSETIKIKTDNSNLTEEQFFQICNLNKELKFERDKNQNICIMSPTGALTGNYHISITGRLWIWNENKKSGYIFDSSAGFTLPDNSVFAPDVAWISKNRWDIVPQEDKERFAHICPDFVIEVRSKTDSLKQQKQKMQEWLNNGCRLAWLIDFENKTSYIYKPKSDVIQQSFDQVLRGEDVLHGFELNLKEII